MAHPVDLRSDTVTRPTAEMRRVIAQAEVGDDVLGDDPTVLALQEKFAALLGKEAACFVPTGTMANQAALRAHTEPGDEVIAHEGSHIIHYETGAPAALSGIMVRTINAERGGGRGVFTPESIEPLVRPKSVHFANSKVLLVENTHNRGGGAVWSLAQINAVAAEGRRLGLNLHMDGARLWNACAATGVEPRAYAEPFDTVSCCFSKGLGCPAGSAVAGSRDLIARVARFRKMFGGTMRQSGMLAAAAIYALDHHRVRLAEDHANARRLAEGLTQFPGLQIDLAEVETNILFFDLGPGVRMNGAEFCERMKAEGVLMLAPGPRRVRCVTHLDVDAAGIERTLIAAQKVLGGIAARV